MRTNLPHRVRGLAAVSRRDPRTGFTLIEMMVVIAVIVFIAVLLLPTLSRAKAKAQQVDCLSRQKQWALAFRMYADDNENNCIAREGYGPFGAVELNNWGQVKGIGGDSDDVWYNALASYVGVPRAASYALPNKRIGFYQQSSLFHCPTARFQPYVTQFAPPSPPYSFAIFSIAMNSQLIEFPYGPTIRFDRIEDETRTVLFLDNLLEREKKVHPAQESVFLGQPAAYADRFSARHYGGGNLAFADGHVSWFPGNRVVETDPNSPLRGGPIMPPVDVVWEPKYEF